MFRVFIWAGDLMFQGANDMDNWLIETVSSWEEAEAIAQGMSYDVINDYSPIYEALEEKISYKVNSGTSDDEYESLLEQVMEEDLKWYVWKINEDLVNHCSDEELWRMAEEDWGSFVDEYCEAREDCEVCYDRD